VLLNDVLRLVRLHPDEWHLGEEDLGLRLFESTLLGVPAAALDIKTPDIGAIGSLRRAIELSIVLDHVVPPDQIDSDRVLPGEVLLETRQEGLGEEEARDPEVAWLALINPLVDEIEALHEVDDVGGERLQRGVRPLRPEGWDPVVEQ